MKYKIVKKPGLHTSLERFLVYRKGWFFWIHCTSEWSQKDAERWIDNDKKIRELNKKKPEVIGYY